MDDNHRWQLAGLAIKTWCGGTAWRHDPTPVQAKLAATWYLKKQASIHFFSIGCELAARRHGFALEYR
jgi:hypothetical protein